MVFFAALTPRAAPTFGNFVTSGVASGKQPKGKRVPPLVSEYKSIITERTYGIAWTPEEFVKQARGALHPRRIENGVPKILKETIVRCAQESPADLARERTATLRRWMLTSEEAVSRADPSDMPDHCAAVLGKKSMKVFKSLLTEAEYPDTTLTKDVRAATPLARKAILASTREGFDREVAESVYQLTKDELAKGWLKGPFKESDIPPDAIVTRRFGIVQSSTDAKLGSIKKVRPIDDYTESLANLTNSASETICPHGVDVVVAALCLRIRSARKLGKREQLVLRTIDLRKAYKQLPLSTEALYDSFIAVLNPHSMEIEIYQTVVLPFGSKPAVQGFYRTAFGLWWIGVRSLILPWSLYFDDFVLPCSSDEQKHLDLVQSTFFRIVAWETSSEKDSGFDAVAKVLGVQISLADSKNGLISVQNTEARKRELCSSIDEVLTRGFVGQNELLSLRGRLLFAESQIFGRSASLHMRNLSHFCQKHGRLVVGASLRASLTFLRDRVVLGKPRCVDSSLRQVYHVYTDASYDDQGGGLGGLVYDFKGLCLAWFSEVVTSKDLEIINPDGKLTLIYELETLAAVLGATLIPNLRHCDIVLFVDNEASLAALIRGQSDCPFVQSLLSRLFQAEEERDLAIWFERVRSESNPADAPSRGDHSFPAFSRRRFNVQSLLTDLCGSLQGGASQGTDLSAPTAS
ncbi:unnamed protein product [Symbiodinium sp. CCMP2592]|nr:unnamed protein product [Symbiodinium sp. CCMP2592]